MKKIELIRRTPYNDLKKNMSSSNRHFWEKEHQYGAGFNECVLNVSWVDTPTINKNNFAAIIYLQTVMDFPQSFTPFLFAS